MSLPSILRQIAKKSSHPNALVYDIQRVKAKSQLLPAGRQLGDGREDVFALEAPRKECEIDEGVKDADVEGVMGGNDGNSSGDGVAVEGKKSDMGNDFGGKER